MWPTSATFFAAEGHRVRLFTAAWQKGWPTECSFRDFEVQRLSRPLSGPWGTYRYQRALIRELEVFKADAVLLFDGGEDLGPVRKLVGDKVPCVVRVDHRAISRMSRAVQKSLQLEHADSLICDSLQTRNELVMRKLSLPSQIELAVDGVPIPDLTQRSIAEQANARTALGDAHPILRIDPAQPLVVTAAPLVGDGGVVDLVRAWKVVLESFPKGKLWIVGDGPRTQKVWDKITELDMIYSAILPGHFDDLETILAAADLYVHPLRAPVNCRFLMEAVAAGVCPVVTGGSVESLPKRDAAGSRVGELVEFERDVSGIIAPAGNPTGLGEAITMALRHSDLRAKLGSNARSNFKSAIDLNRIGKTFLNRLSVPVQSQDTSGAPRS